VNSTLEINCTLSDTRVAPNASINGTYLGEFDNFTCNLHELGIYDSVVRDDKDVLVVTIIISVTELSNGTLITCTDDSTSYRIIAQGYNALSCKHTLEDHVTMLQELQNWFGSLE